MRDLQNLLILHNLHVIVRHLDQMIHPLKILNPFLQQLYRLRVHQEEQMLQPELIESLLDNLV